MGGTEGLGDEDPPAGSRGRAPGGWFGGGIASRKLIAVINDIWLPNHAQFCVFSSTAQPGIFLRTQFRGRAPRPLAAPLVHPQRRRELGGFGVLGKMRMRDCPHIVDECSVIARFH